MDNDKLRSPMDIPDSVKEKVPELMHRLGISGEQLQNVKLGPELLIENHPANPAMVAMGINHGYYELTHVPTGKKFQIMHRVYEYMFR